MWSCGRKDVRRKCSWKRTVGAADDDTSLPGVVSAVGRASIAEAPGVVNDPDEGFPLGKRSLPCLEQNQRKKKKKGREFQSAAVDGRRPPVRMRPQQ